jgi:hypothetical protein
MTIGQAGKKRISNNILGNFGHNKPSEFYPNNLPLPYPLPYIFFKDLRISTYYKIIWGRSLFVSLSVSLPVRMSARCDWLPGIWYFPLCIGGEGCGEKFAATGSYYKNQLIVKFRQCHCHC